MSVVYLIAAECCPDPKVGRDYLNVVRSARNVKNVEDEVDLMTAIEQEFRREFLGEGQLFFYYKRKLYDIVGAEDKVGIEDLKAVYNLPIPTSEIDFGNIKN